MIIREFCITLVSLVFFCFVPVFSQADVTPEKVYNVSLFQDELFVAKMKQSILRELDDSRLYKDEEFAKFQKNNPEIISSKINRYLSDNTRSLLKESGGSTDLKYYFSGNEIRFTTPANYYTSTPVCAGDKLDFDILTVSNFGLRGYFIKTESCEITQFGSHNTAYYSVAYDRKNNFVAFSVPGHYKIDVYTMGDWKLVNTIKGYAATTVEFYEGDLYFAGYAETESWKEAGVYRYSLDNDKILASFYDKELADVRGLSFYDGVMAVSNGIHNHILFYNLRSNTRVARIDGFHYPNGIHYVNHSGLLVADEHSNYIRKIDLDNMSEEWYSPPGQLKSPGSVYEIKQGRWKDSLLVSDTDNNRLLVVEPKTWRIVFEISGVRSSLKSIPVYHQN